MPIAITIPRKAYISSITTSFEGNFVFSRPFATACAWYRFVSGTRISTISRRNLRWNRSNGASASVVVLDLPLCSKHVMLSLGLSKLSASLQISSAFAVFAFAAAVGVFVFVERVGVFFFEPFYLLEVLLTATFCWLVIIFEEEVPAKLDCVIFLGLVPKNVETFAPTRCCDTESFWCTKSPCASLRRGRGDVSE